MDEPVRHIIRRQTLIVKGVREWEAQDLQREVSNVFREKILPLLDKYLTDYSPNGALHRFDKLEFNLGPVHRDQLEKEMIKQMSVKLKVQFPTSAHISKPVSQKIEPRSKITSHLELFKYFVETGSLPWWSDSSVTDPLNESLAFLVEHKTTAFISLLQSLAGQPAKLERIVRHFTFPKWVDLAALKMNVSSDILHAMILQLMQMLRKIEPWQVISIDRIQELVGIKLLAWVNLSASESQNTPDFWKGFLLQLASSQKLSYADLLSKLYNQIPEKTKTIVKTPNRLLRQIEDLWEAYNEQYKSQTEIREDLILRVREALKMEFLPLQMKVKLEAALNLLSLKKLRLKDLVETDDLLKKLMEIEKPKISWIQNFY